MECCSSASLDELVLSGWRCGPCGGGARWIVHAVPFWIVDEMGRLIGELDSFRKRAVQEVQEAARASPVRAKGLGMAQDFLGAVGEIGDRHRLFRRLNDVDHQAQDFGADSLEVVHQRLDCGAWGGGRRAALRRLIVSPKAATQRALVRLRRHRVGWRPLLRNALRQRFGARHSQATPCRRAGAPA